MWIFRRVISRDLKEPASQRRRALFNDPSSFLVSSHQGSSLNQSKRARLTAHRPYSDHRIIPVCRGPRAQGLRLIPPIPPSLLVPSFSRMARLVLNVRVFVYVSRTAGKTSTVPHHQENNNFLAQKDLQRFGSSQALMEVRGATDRSCPGVRDKAGPFVPSSLYKLT